MSFFGLLSLNQETRGDKLGVTRVATAPTSIKFGTDGWRGLIAADFTFDNVRRCAQAVATYLLKQGTSQQGIIIGYDTRFASEDFAAACAEVLAANGIPTFLCTRATPTPVISYSVLTGKRAGAIIITASHNPGRWNGFKVKSPLGTSAPTDMIARLEGYIGQISYPEQVKSMPLEKGISSGIISKVDLAPDYMVQVSRLVDLKAIRDAGLSIVIDSMFGAGAGYFKTLLDGGSTRALEIDKERNPLFPGIERPEPIDVNLKKLCAAVKRRKAHVGLATDGDADRVGVVDDKGNYLTPLQVFALLALYLLEVRGMKGALVRTVTSSTMIDKLGGLFRVPVYETPVGFKYVAPEMLAHDAIMGGEESGGYGFRGHVLERDGILAGAYFLDLMVKTGKSPSQLVDYLYSKVGPHYYRRLDLEFAPEARQEVVQRVAQSQPDRLAGTTVARSDRKDGFRYILADESWLLIRFSGTEPVLRIYAEAGKIEQVQALLETGRKLTGV